MIENFDEVKRQLKELSEVVNAFKSEAVQLRLIDLVFGGVASEDTSSSAESESTPRRGVRKKSAKAVVLAKPDVTTAAKSARTPRSGARLGGRSTLTRLQNEGYFKKPRTINDIVQHAETNLATKLKQSDLSGPLARYVRDKKLKRSKNKDNQYEYIEA